ncbi:hypothetical protein [Candidatus Kuenenia stuttgartiensis]|uniref:hypothetical protein n=1 Tax=Kuenenia stuttgartiensis TaxID=174633 RepID=UPI00146CBA4B|nr:hypothetical protein [Candidatus Kuenenia stuttgartiensis]
MGKVESIASVLPDEQEKKVGIIKELKASHKLYPFRECRRCDTISGIENHS